MMIVVLFAFVSCERSEMPDGDSDLRFSQTCDFTGSEVEAVNRLSGTLRYTNNILDIPPAELHPSQEYVFLIRSPGPGRHLGMVVCNMPFDFEMAEGESRNVTFSGRVVVFSDGIVPSETDATSTWIELSYLKFE